MPSKPEQLISPVISELKEEKKDRRIPIILEVTLANPDILKF